MAEERRGDGRQAGGYRHPDAVIDEALDWFLRLREERDAQALADFAAWRASDPARDSAYADLVRMHEMPALRQAAAADAARLAAPPHARKRHSPRRRSPAWLSAFAGGAAVAIALFGLLQYPALRLQWQSDFITQTGERETVSLPDGSRAVLNTASAIAVDFEDGRRRVSLLQGEVFFDVQHDPEHPFVVAGQFSEVEVKGTAFSVRADEAEDVIILEEGSVEVSRIGAVRDKAMLRPGEMITASQNGLSAVSASDPARLLAWREGRIVFHDRRLGSALAEMKRHYRGTVLILSPGVADRLVSGNYRIDDPEAAIRTLAVSARASVTRLPGGILILR